MWIIEIALGVSLVLSGGQPPQAQAPFIEYRIGTGTLLPDQAWPLTEGRASALKLAKDVLESHRVVRLRDDTLVYLGGGVTARPADFHFTSITINWSMIRKEIESESRNPADLMRVVQPE